MFFSRLRIVGRKKKIGDPDGVNAVLYVDLLGKPMALQTEMSAERVVHDIASGKMSLDG